MASSNLEATKLCIDSPVLAEAIEKLFREVNSKKSSADLHFLFNEDGRQKRIPAHKFILKATSDVFATMLNGDWMEQNEVEIEDASSAAFKEFLQFLYLPKVEISSENVCEVVYLANKYNIRKCMELCAQHIQDQLTSDNVCTGLDFALQYNLGELKEQCLEKISDDTNEILKTDGFLRCSKDSLKTILALDDIDCDEIKLFNVCLNWAKQACKTKKNDPSIMTNVRKELGDCLHLIRFGAMTPKEVADCVAENDGLFDSYEEKDLWLAFGSDQSRVKIFKKSAARARGRRGDKELMCDLRTNDLLGYPMCDIASASFQISEPLLFGGISVAGIKNGLPNSIANLSVSEVALNQQKNVLQQIFPLTTNSLYLKFIKPIPLQVNTIYNVYIEIERVTEMGVYYGLTIGPNHQKIFGDSIVLCIKSKRSSFIQKLHFDR